MSRIIKQVSDRVEMLIFVVIALVAVAGIVRFIILADIF
jgi:hypothetical protein